MPTLFTPSRVLPVPLTLNLHPSNRLGEAEWRRGLEAYASSRE